jgi:tRNA/tmRNA/rRNA uracil-C5-methylase (TrmA/RlmC/RlmD family)
VCTLDAPRIVYVSCNPEKLASEAKRFNQRGYRIANLQGVDMFPHTEHIEAVAVFRRLAPGPS